MELTDILTIAFWLAVSGIVIAAVTIIAISVYLAFYPYNPVDKETLKEIEDEMNEY
jgi:uncharacterized membrane protein (DUF106 family)